jgi:hypothetical protein
MILYISDLFRWLMRTSVRTSRKSGTFQFLLIEQVNPRAMTTQRAWAA